MCIRVIPRCHPQLLSDFSTICDLAKRLNDALDTEPERSGIKRRFWAGVFAVKEWLSRAWSWMPITHCRSCHRNPGRRADS
jgi:hypothetical protein